MSAYPGISRQNGVPSLKSLLIYRVIHRRGEKFRPKIHRLCGLVCTCDAPQLMKSKVNATLVIFNAGQAF